MNYKIMVRIQSWILIIECAFMFPALLLALAFRDMPAIRGFLITMAIAFGAACAMQFYSRNAEKCFYAREGLVCTALVWLMMSAVGCLPFFLSGRIPSFVDAYFEIMSGFTTTGASILTDVEMLGKGLLYWRSFSHWIGGMGVLVFFLAIIPTTGRNDGYMLHILRAESPGPSVSKMVPRLRDTAAILYMMYCALTVADIILLLVGGMPVFDAFCIAFGTAGTGGFAVLNSGCATYTPFAQYVTTVFMLLFGVNFSLYYYLLLRRFKMVRKDEELHLYLLVVGASILFIAFNIFRVTPETQGLEPTVRHSAFQVASIVTTTGFSTVNFDLWPTFSKAILLCLMFMGACAGSTGGGIKSIRVLLLVRNLRRSLHQVFHPHEVQIVRVNGQRVQEQTLITTNSYLAAYVMIVIVSFLVLSLDRANFTLTTNFSAVMATLNNIGPGFDSVGPAANFSGYSNLSKIVMIFDMLFGRLEIFPVLALMSPGTYRRNL